MTTSLKKISDNISELRLSPYRASWSLRSKFVFYSKKVPYERRIRAEFFSLTKDGLFLYSIYEHNATIFGIERTGNRFRSHLVVMGIDIV